MTTESRTTNRSALDAQGRILIPAEIRREKGWEPGQELEIHVVDGRTMILTREEAIRLAQDIFSRGIPEDISLVDELIAERRAAAARGD